MTPTPEPLWTSQQLADYLGISAAAVRMMRSRGQGPRFIRLGKNVKYRPEDVRAWLAENTAQPAA